VGSLSFWLFSSIFMACRARSARPLRGFEVSCVGHPSIGAGADLRRLPMTISFTRWLRQALTRRCSVRNCGLPA
jgi:hypothetical protein